MAPGGAGGPSERRPGPVAPRTGIDRIFTAGLALGFVLVAVGIRQTAGLQLDAYPVAAVSWMDTHGLRGPGHRVAEQDIVGDYLIWRDGRRAAVFIDDRYDMYPVSVSQDSITLVDATPGSLDVLDCRRIDAVLWDRRAALSELLQASGRWSNVHHTARWVVFARKEPILTGLDGRPTKRDGTACPGQD